MKKSNVIALLLILAQINLLEALECKLEAPARGLLQFSDPQKDIAEYYCQQFGIRKDMGNVHQVSFDECIAAIMPYMKDVKDTKESIKNYIQYCNDDGMRYNTCTDLIVQLKDYCWDSKTIVNTLISQPQFHGIQRVNHITISYFKITPEDYKMLQVGEMSLLNCLQFVASEGTPKIGENKIDVLKEYIRQNGNTKCDCIEVIKFDEIEKKFSLKEKISDLICNDTKKDYFWTIEQLNEILKTDFNSHAAKKYKINSNVIKDFFVSAGSYISEAQWQDSFREWNFLELINHIQTNNKLDPLKIDLISKAILAGFSLESYTELNKKVLAEGGPKFNNDECRLKMMKKMFLKEFCKEKPCTYGRYFEDEFKNRFDITISNKKPAESTCEEYITNISKRFRQDAPISVPT